MYIGNRGFQMQAKFRFAFLIAAFQTALFAQSTSATVTGTVTDQTGASIGAAAISVANDATGVNRQTRTSDSGNYAVSLLPAGVYRITVVRDGFRPVTRSSIELKVDQVARIDFTLEVGGVTEKIEVTADAPLLDSETSALGQVVDQDKIVNLPLNGRMTFRLVQLTPGILAPPGSNGQFGDVSVGTFDDVNFSVNGGRAQSNAVVVDGVPANTGFLNLFTTIPSVDATQEFKVQSNAASAEYGRFGGGVLNVSTRGGTNQYHGSVFEFLRNNHLNANDFFNKLAGNQTPAFHMNQYGGAIGGPLQLGRLYDGKNRTFFFANYEGTRWRRGAVNQYTLPTTVERGGNFSQTLNAAGQLIVVYDPVTTRANPAGGFIRDPFSGNVIPQSRMDPVGVAILKHYPVPNLVGNPITHASNYISNAPTRVNKDDGAIRIDQNITSNYRMFGRFETTFNQLHQPDTFNDPSTPGVGANGDIIFHYYTGAWDNTYTASPTRIFNLRYGFARFYWARNTRSYGFDQTSLGLPASYVSQLQLPVFPTIGMDGGYSGMAGGSFIRTGQDTHSLLPSMTSTSNRQTLKIGADIRLRRNNLWIIQNGGGSFNFARAMTAGPNPNAFAANAGSAVASMLLGTASSGTVGSVPGVSLQNWYIGGYVQDDIKLTRKLTVNLGLRYETESPYTERRNTLAWFNSAAASPITNAAFSNLKGSVQYADTGGNSRHPYSWDANNFAPRVGLAYSISKRLVFRSAFGVFFAGLETNNDLNNYSPVSGTSFSGTTAYLGTLDGITPFHYVSNPYPTGLTPPSGVNAASMLGQAISSWDYTARTPYNLQWNADFQYQITRNLLIDAAYAGSRGAHYARTIDANALNPLYASYGTQLNTLVPNPFFGQIKVGTLSQPTVALSQLFRPYPQYTNVTIINSPTADSSYHSIQLKLEQRMSHGQSFLVSFTGEKLLSNSNNSLAGLGVQNNGTSIQTPYNLSVERSLSEQDEAKALTISYVTELPFGKGHALLQKGIGGKLLGGWNLSGQFTYKGGLPIAVSAPIPGGGNRPNSTGQSAELSSDRTRGQKIAQWFNTTAFTLPPSYTYGNVSRTLPDVRGPSVTNIDASLVRTIKFKEKVGLQIRAEAFNLFNVPHFWMPVTGFGNVQFGQITSTNITALPRVLQFAMKLTF
jgi:hypothetical protein